MNWRDPSGLEATAEWTATTGGSPVWRRGRWARSGRAHGGRPPFDPVLMFEILVIQAQNDLSDERAEFLISHRLSFMRFPGLGLHDRVPDAWTIWSFRDRLTRAGAIAPLFENSDTALRTGGYIAMSGQLVDSTLIAAPRKRNTEGERLAIIAGESAAEIWPDQPAKAAQKDTNARWTVQFGKARVRADRTVPPGIAIQTFGYMAPASIDRAHRFIRC